MNPFQGFVGVCVLAVSVALFLCCLTGGIFIGEQQAALPGAALNPYADTCVVTVTHPDLSVYLKWVERAGDCCNRCRYWFALRNLTAGIGTYATNVTVRGKYTRGPMFVDGTQMPGWDLYDFRVGELEPIRFEVVGDEVLFWVEAPCPGCLFGDEGCIHLVVEYHDCSGGRQVQASFDLKTQHISASLPLPLPPRDCYRQDP